MELIQNDTTFSKYHGLLRANIPFVNRLQKSFHFPNMKEITFLFYAEHLKNKINNTQKKQK